MPYTSLFLFSSKTFLHFDSSLGYFMVPLSSIVVRDECTKIYSKICLFSFLPFPFNESVILLNREGCTKFYFKVLLIDFAPIPTYECVSLLIRGGCIKSYIKYCQLNSVLPLVMNLFPVDQMR